MRARIGVELGELYRAVGDAKKARASFAAVLEAGGDADASLAAARGLDGILTELKERQALAAVLAKLADIEPDDAARVTATERLAVLAEELRDPAGAIHAYKRLVDTPREDAALEALERLLEAAGSHAELASVLKRRAARTSDRALAKQLSLRAAEIRTKLGERAPALEAWRSFVQTFGPSREAFARLLPLLEQERAWEELAATVAADADLAPPADRAPIFARLGQLRATRLGDAGGALAAYGRALEADPNERASRLALDRLLTAGDQRLAAADVLEPIARRESPPTLLARVLEARGGADERASARLGALAEAAELCAAGLKDAKRALDVAGKGLAIALDEARAGTAEGERAVASWLERIDAFSAAAGDAARTAGVLRQALGERAIDSDATLLVARRAGDALVASGDPAASLAVFRAALAYKPSSPDLLERVDMLLREQGSPGERLSLYRAALEQAGEHARRRQLLHAIAGIERRDLDDPAAALATYRRALAEAPDDRAAFDAVTDIHAAARDFTALYDELARAEEAGTFDDHGALSLRLADAAQKADRGDRAAQHFAAALASDAAIADDVLVEIDRLAAAREDWALAIAAIERRLAAVTEPIDEAGWLERLAEIEATRLGKQADAAARLERAAERALAGLDAALGERLLVRALAVDPSHVSSATRLLDLHRDADRIDKQAEVYPLLLRAAPSLGDALDLVVAFEPVATKAAAHASFVEEASALLAREPPVFPDAAAGASARDTLPEVSAAAYAEARRVVRAARARVLASRAETASAAADEYRAMMEEDGDVDATAAFEALAASRGAEGLDDRRWLHTFRAERAAEDDRARLLVAWAQFEEAAHDGARAAELYGRVLVHDPDHVDALTARARLLREIGDLDGAAAAIAARRDRSEGAARTLLELELGELLLDGLNRADDALDAISDVLEASPSDAAAHALVRRAMSRPKVALRAARMLEKAADTVDDAALSAEIIDSLLAASAGLPELGEPRRGWFERALDRPDQPPELTFEVALRAVSEIPDDGTLWERAEKLGRTLGQPARVAEAYRARLASWTAAGPMSRPACDVMEDVGRRAVEHLEEWFDDPEAVVVLLRNVVELAPTSAWAFERLKLVFNLGERWDELFSLYDIGVRREQDDAARADLLEDAAFAAKDLAGDAPRATTYFEMLLPLRRTPRIQGALERLYERQGKHRELIHVLTPDLTELSGEAAHRLRARLAELWLEGVGDPASALELAGPLLGADAHRKDAIGLLERILTGAKGGGGAEDRATTRRTATLLRGRYEEDTRHEDVARVLSIELAASDEPAARADLLRRIVDLRRGVLRDEAGAFEGLAELALLTPDDDATRAELVTIGRGLRAFDRLGDVLARAASRAGEARRGAVYALASGIFDREVGDAPRAIELARSALVAHADDAAGALAAARELDRLLAAAGRDPEREGVLDRIAALDPDREAKRAALVESG
ncbi:MAG TPA: hypothetical protein VGM56_13165, partial [Byssovorax sp.]